MRPHDDRCLYAASCKNGTKWSIGKAYPTLEFTLKSVKVNEMKKFALQQQILKQRRQLMDSINQNTVTANNMNIHPQLQSNLQMRLPTSVQNGVQTITPQVNGSPKKLFQPPPPTSVTEPPADIEIDTESKKSLLEVKFSRISGLSG